MNIELKNQGPIAISKDDECLDKNACRPLLDQLSDRWSINEENRLNAVFLFKNFVSALGFLNQVGEKAEAHQHHPDCLISWGRLEVSLWTHDLGGLHLADFSLAAQIDELWNTLKQ
ncbi:MAG: pterin-4-alpha-carbinolamine dehydratase [Myxococcales bacterium]|nr:pterin-4-alpha-carbinolamine dehydratase [Myxococcales bacterium]